MSDPLAITAELLANAMQEHHDDVVALNSQIEALRADLQGAKEAVTTHRIAEANAVGQLEATQRLLATVEETLQKTEKRLATVESALAAERTKVPAKAAIIAPPEYVLSVEGKDETGRMTSLRVTPVKGKT